MNTHKREGLTDIEHRIVEMIAQGSYGKEIAAALHWSEIAVHVQVKLLEKRFGVSSRAELLAELQRRGLWTSA